MTYIGMQRYEIIQQERNSADTNYTAERAQAIPPANFFPFIIGPTTIRNADFIYSTAKP